LRQFNETLPSPVEKTTSETGNSSLQTPTEKSSLSDESDGLQLDSDTKRMEEDELNAIKFDVSFFLEIREFRESEMERMQWSQIIVSTDLKTR
jgi:hypothetical protein